VSRRSERVAEVIRQEAGRIIVSKLNDPRIGFVTVTRVEVSADLSVAKIYVSVLNQKGREGATLRGLESAKRHIQNAIGESLGLRKTPALIFRADPGVKQSIRIGGILNELARERGDEAAPPTAGEEGGSEAPEEEEDDEEEEEESEDDG